MAGLKDGQCWLCSLAVPEPALALRAGSIHVIPLSCCCPFLQAGHGQPAIGSRPCLWHWVWFGTAEVPGDLWLCRAWGWRWGLAPHLWGFSDDTSTWSLLWLSRPAKRHLKWDHDACEESGILSPVWFLLKIPNFPWNLTLPVPSLSKSINTRGGGRWGEG